MRFDAYLRRLTIGTVILIGGMPGLALADDPPLPKPGEEVRWGLDISPIEITRDLTIPATGKVTVDPGVVINVRTDMTLFVAGDLVAEGLDGQSVEFNGSISIFEPPFFVTGLLDVQYGVVNCQFAGNSPATMLFTDTLFTSRSALGWSNFGNLGHTAKFISLERCLFESTRVILGTSLSIVDTTFRDTFVSLAGFLHLRNVVSDGGSVQFYRTRRASQTLLVDDLVVRNVSDGPGLDLNGWDYFIGGNVVIEDNLYPVRLDGAGLTAGSAIPQTGNLNNEIRVFNGRGGNAIFVTWPDVGLPYVVDGTATGMYHRIDPGVTVRFTADSELLSQSFHKLVVKGLPDKPITLMADDPDSPWQGIFLTTNGPLPMFENMIVEGAKIGLLANASRAYVGNSVFRDNQIAAAASNYLDMTVRKSRFFDNAIALRTSASTRYFASDRDSPNTFEGNELAFQDNNRRTEQFLKYNWWGAESGPKHPDNPDGTGDPIDVHFAYADPFLTQRPSYDDAPPMVWLDDLFFLVEAREKIILQWRAKDDRKIVAQRIDFATHGWDFKVLVDNLPGDLRSIELDVPLLELSNLVEPPTLRVVAIDDAGQEGYDNVDFSTPYQEDWTPPSLKITSPSGGEYASGDEVQVCWESGRSGIVSAVLFLEADDRSVGLGGTTTKCLSGKLSMPYVSTDLARVGVVYSFGASGRVAWYFSDYFTIRPDPRVGDAPPTIEMLSPQDGQRFAGGTTIPVRWTADDDEQLRGFAVQASYDGGRTWHFIARDLPADATRFDWRLPKSTGIDDVRVRVIARDRRFQNSSDGGDRRLAITPGEPSNRGDTNCDGSVDLVDVSPFITALLDPAEYERQYPDCDINNADLNDDGSIDLTDVEPFIELLLG